MKCEKCNSNNTTRQETITTLEMQFLCLECSHVSKYKIEKYNVSEEKIVKRKPS